MRYVLIFIMALFLGGCVQKTTYTELTPNFIGMNMFKKSVEIHASGIALVDTDFYDAFEKAIGESVQRSNLFSQVVASGSDVTLNTFLVRVSTPIAAINFDATVEVAWTLKQNGRVIYRRSFTTSSSQIRTSFAAIDRAKSAINAAVKENIALALTDISRQKL
ncbi:hypothetical protein [Campylobacter sp.]|uniref:hypothetical protein n=1 Tax=Campylobacter sp. TaxID=205 RepID=UPI0025C47100|nr:hypothetical protein [Campylobacter sp.]